jgi:hypothetical protein
MTPLHRFPIVVGLLAGCLVGIVALRGGGPSERRPDPVLRAPADDPLLARGAGPSGSAEVTLGWWRYRADPADVGRRRGWRHGAWRGRPVRVPFVPNARPVTGAGAARGYAGSVGWYARVLNAPRPGRYALRFASAHHRATVWIDGRRVREHAGAYEPFSATARLGAGRHVIAVRVDWRHPERLERMGWARAWFNYGGLNRPVTVARLGPTSLGALTVRTRLLRGRRARLDVSVRVGNRRGARRVALAATLRHGGRAIRLARRSGSGARLPASSGTLLRARTTTTVRFTAVVPRAQLWSPGRPALHALQLRVPGEATLRRRVGLRAVRVRRGRLELNRRPLRLLGAGLPPDARGHGDALTASDERRLVSGLRALGANATRSQLPLSQSLLERLDAAGILVWQQIGPWEPAAAWRSTTPRARRSARDRALRTVDAQQAHPSVLTWTLTNEAAGQGRPAQLRWVRDLARRLHERDPGRPVAADLWGRHLPRKAGPLYAELDALGLTDYVGWYEAPDAPGVQAALVRERIARLRALFPAKAVVVTEFGAVGTDRLPDRAFGGERFQARFLAQRAQLLAGTGAVDGMLVWNLRDYALRPDFRGGSVVRLKPGLRLTPGLNEKGLFDFAGRPKPALHGVRRAFARTRR